MKLQKCSMWASWGRNTSAYFITRYLFPICELTKKGVAGEGRRRRIGKFPLFPLLHGELVFGRFLYCLTCIFPCPRLSLSYISNIIFDPERSEHPSRSMRALQVRSNSAIRIIPTESKSSTQLGEGLPFLAPSYPTSFSLPPSLPPCCGGESPLI